MRRLLAGGVIGLLLVGVAATAGCDSKGSSQPPQQQMELPKEGPQPVGGPKGGGGSGSGQNSASQ